MKKIVFTLGVVAISGFTASAVTGDFLYAGIVFAIGIVTGFFLAIKSTPNPKKRYA